MEFLAPFFRPESWWIWSFILALALFFPVRKLIWVLMVRRAAHFAEKNGQQIDDAEIARLKRRASITAVLLCYVVAVLYTFVILGKSSAL